MVLFAYKVVGLPDVYAKATAMTGAYACVQSLAHSNVIYGLQFGDMSQTVVVTTGKLTNCFIHAFPLLYSHTYIIVISVVKSIIDISHSTQMSCVALTIIGSPKLNFPSFQEKLLRKCDTTRSIEFI